MPTKTKAIVQHKPAQPANAAQKPKPTTQYQWKSKGLAQSIGDSLKDGLACELDAFVKNAYPEEVHFLLRVLQERDNDGPNDKSRDEHDVPLFTAIDQVLNGSDRPVLLLPDRHMLRPVEELINSLQEASEKNAPARDAYTPTELREIRQKAFRRLMDIFMRDASNDDLYFMVSVLNRWDAYCDYEEQYRPPSPILAATKMEIEGQHWLIPVPWQHGANSRALLGMISQKGWLGDLLTWVAEQGAENLSPCLVSAKAAGMQQAFDAANPAA